MFHRRSVHVLLVVVTAVVSGFSSASSNCLDYASYRHWLGQTMQMFGLRRFDLSGTRAIICGTGSRLFDMDTADPENILGYFISETWFPGDVRVSGSYVFVAGSSGLKVLNLSTLSEAATLPGSYGLLDISANLAVVAASSTIRLVDISNPTSPVLKGFVTLPASVLDVELVGSLVYAAAADGFRVVDASNQNSPSAIGFSPGTQSTTVQGLAVQGNRAYIAAGPSGANGTLRIIDISNPAAPVQLSSVTTVNMSPNDAAVTGNYLFTANTNSEVQVWDVSDPANPTVVDNFNNFSGANPIRLVLDGTRLYCTTSDGSLHVMSWSAPQAPALTGGPSTSAVADLAVFGTHAYGCSASEFAVFDLSDPANPAVQSTLALPGGAALSASGSLVGVAMGASGVHFIDVANPAAPAPRGTLDLADDALDIALNPPYAYVAENFSGIAVIDVSDPLHPALLNEIPTANHAVGLSLVGSALYVCEENDLVIYDLVDPASPAEANDLGLDTAGEVSVSGSDVLVTGSYQVMWFNASDPFNPAFNGAHYAFPSRKAVKVGTTAYVTSGSSDGIFALDMSTGFLHTIGSQHRFGQSIGALASYQGYVYVGDVASNRLRTLPLQCTASGAPVRSSDRSRAGLALGPPTPNPTASSVEVTLSADGDGIAQAEIMDVRGRLVRRIGGFVVEGGTGRVSWDGRLETGNAAPAGLYFIRVRLNDHEGLTRLIRIPG